MAQMQILNEAELSRMMMTRYQHPYVKFQTFIGDTLLVVNPFKNHEIYSNKSIVFSYIRDTFREEGEKRSQFVVYSDQGMVEKPPHNYDISARAFSMLFSGPDSKKQAICIAGESGAGKTESTKINLKQITILAEYDANDYKDYKPPEKWDMEAYQKFVLPAPAIEMDSKGEPKPSLVDKIMSQNPILESWGNAKTVRIKSRFWPPQWIFSAVAAAHFGNHPSSKGSFFRLF